MTWEKHPTKTCPNHPAERLTFTRSKTQLVCTAHLDCDYYERVDGAVQIPKAVARAMSRVRKRTRRMLAKKAECSCVNASGNACGHDTTCARYSYEDWRYWKRRKQEE